MRQSTGWEKAASKQRFSGVPSGRSNLREEAPISRLLLGGSEIEEIVVEERSEGKIIYLIQGPV